MSRFRLPLTMTMVMLIVVGAACSGGPGEAEMIATQASAPTATPAPTPVPTPTSAPAPTSTRSATPEPTAGPPTQTVTAPDRSARRADGSLDVIFRVAVPPGTAPGSTILMTGDRPALGSGVVMKPLDSNPLVYEGEVVFGHDGTLNYRFELNNGEAVSGPLRVETDYDGQIVNDQITSWSSAR